MRNIFIFIIASLFLLSFTSAFGERLDKEITITTIEPTIVTYERHIDYYADTRLDEILEIAVINAGSHEYRLHSYDCTQFSEKLVSLLEDKGYKAQCTAGNSWQSDYTNHTWVSVWIDENRYEIEATNGNLIEQWVFDEGYYTKWKEDYCW